MAKNKNYRERIEGMGKRELNALNREIRDHYAEHGWRKTVGEYKIAPTDLSAIVGDAKKSKPDKKPKAKKAKAQVDKKKPAKRGRPKKVEKKPAEKKKPAKRGRPKKKSEEAAKAKGKKAKKKTAKKTRQAAKVLAPTAEDHLVLDYLLRRRKKSDPWRNPETVDMVILELTTKIRGV